MPFELGLAVAHARRRGRLHEWFVFEARSHRLNKSLSDLDGTDPFIHGGTPHGVLRSLANALSRTNKAPTLRELETVFRDLKVTAGELKRDQRDGSLFEARPFRELVIFARISAKDNISSVRVR